jgi:ABC-type uncharacterized transport system fused permease/ATPase subunit
MTEFDAASAGKSELLRAMSEIWPFWCGRIQIGKGRQQQQLAFARILLAEPAVVFLDDATSALDERLEARLSGLLRAGASRPTIVSASYKNVLFDFHDKILDISDYYPQTNAPLIPTASLAVQG